MPVKSYRLIRSIHSRLTLQHLHNVMWTSELQVERWSGTVTAGHLIQMAPTSSKQCGNIYKSRTVSPNPPPLFLLNHHHQTCAGLLSLLCLDAASIRSCG